MAKPSARPKRRRVDILANILDVAVKGAKKTRIMNDANLSYSLLEKYLKDTVGVGFLQLNNGSYETTEKGRKFRDMYARFSSKHARLRKELETSQLELKVLERMRSSEEGTSSEPCYISPRGIAPQNQSEFSRKMMESNISGSIDRSVGSSVTIIIPTLNEESSIPVVLQRLHGLGYHDILVIDGNSRDQTAHVARNLGAHVVMQDGVGKGDALRQAFNHSSLNGSIVVMMDADGSMNPDEIPRFINSLSSGCDVVKGSRFLFTGYSQDMSPLRRIGNSFFLLLVNLFWSAGYTDLCYGFAVFKNKALDRLRPNLISKNFEIETEVFIKAKKMGLKVGEVPSIELRRRYGKSNLSCFRDGLHILATIIRELLTEPGKESQKQATFRSICK